jgi:hypothetical protein
VIRCIRYLPLRRVLRVFRSDKRPVAEAKLEIAMLTTPDRGPPPAGEAADLPGIQQGVARGRKQDPSAGGLGAFPGSPRDALALAPAARRRRVDHAVPPSVTARTDPEVRKADPATWEREPQVGLHANSGRAAQARGKVSATTIATMLRRPGYEGGPHVERSPPPGGWHAGLRHPPVETKTLYVLIWIELGARKVHLGAAANPDSAGVTTQQARNLSMAP